MNGASLEKRNKQGLSGYDLILKIGNDRFLDFIIPNPDCQPFEAYAFFASKTLTLLI